VHRREPSSEPQARLDAGESRAEKAGGCNAIALLLGRWAFPCLLATVTLITGCSSLPDKLPESTGSPGFELRGRASVKVRDEASSVSVQWRHSGQSDDMLITNPLGQGVARITRADGLVTLETADARRFTAATAESLTERVLGWRLPLTGLPDWLQGRAAPGASSEKRDGPDNQLMELLQDDWRIEYQEYRDRRPVRMRLSRLDLEIRLVIDSWREFAP